jgi:hypothetical protein
MLKEYKFDIAVVRSVDVVQIEVLYKPLDTGIDL